MNVRHAYIFEYKHTHTDTYTQAKEFCTDSFKRCLDFHPPVFRHTQTDARIHTAPPPPPPPNPLLFCKASVRQSGGSKESVCRASCPAASWKAVDFEVFGQVITAGKLLLADDALVWFHSGVGATVSGQLVRSREPDKEEDRM